MSGGVDERTSVSALRYAVRELGRRAGASPQWIARWRIELEGDTVVLYVAPGSGARIVFPFDADKPKRFARLLEAPPQRYAWFVQPSADVAGAVPDFVVHFDEARAAGTPLFTPIAHDTIVCSADVLTATLWHLSRAEELAPGPRDEHGRFAAAASVAARSKTLDRPVVDEYGLAMAQALSALLPSWHPATRTLRAKLSHDVDQVGLPRSWRTTFGHLVRRSIPGAFARDVLSLLGAGVPAYLQAVAWLAAQSQQRGLDSAFYWQAAERATAWEAGYSIEHPFVRNAIERLRWDGVEIGIHPTYGAFESREALHAEVAHMRELLGGQPIGGRQHYLRWEPSSWKAWEKAGLAYDSTVGFADAIGFRAGTAIPYHPWLLDEDRECKLLEIPLLVMDCTPVFYMHLDVDATIAAVERLVGRCRAVGGVFTLLWHNDRSLYEPYATLYPRLLDALAGAQRYDWQGELALAPLPQLDAAPSGVRSSVRGAFVWQRAAEDPPAAVPLSRTPFA